MKNYKERYISEIAPALKSELNLDNVMAVPAFKKVVINIGMSRALKDKKLFEVMKESVAMIAGQRPVITKARKSISNFGIREGMGVGIKATLRGSRMEDFIDKLVRITLPRIRDFKGMSPKSFDGQGNYTMGLKEHTVFPEVKAEEADLIFGMEICFTTSATNNKSARLLMEKSGFIFKK